MLTSRDSAVIEFLARFKVASSRQLLGLFYPESTRYGYARLAKLPGKCPEVHRQRDPNGLQYLYLWQKQKQLKHRLIVTEMFCRLKSGPGELLEYEPEHEQPGLRCDTFFVYGYQGQALFYALEVQLSNEAPDFAKYLRLKDSGKWTWQAWPRIVVVSDRKFDAPKGLAVVQLGADLKGWEKLWKEDAGNRRTT